MSLSVSTFTRDMEGKMLIIEPSDPSIELAGFESFRTKVYGSEIARSIGLRILPVLVDSDLFAEGPLLDELQRDVEVMLGTLQLIASKSGIPEEVLRFRLQNILSATNRARSIDGGVVIW